MACCIIAAYLWAYMTSLLWRWAAYWGLARVPEGVVYPTVYVRVARWVRQAVSRRGLMDGETREQSVPVLRAP